MKIKSVLSTVGASVLLGFMPRLGSAQLNTTSRVSLTNAGAEATFGGRAPSVSSDGRYIAFWSNSPDLVVGDTNGSRDIFVRDRTLSATTRVSLGLGGAQSNDISYALDISADGRYVVFDSNASNLVPGDTNAETDIFVRDRTLGTTSRISVSSLGAQADGSSYEPKISDNGRYVAYYSYATNLVPTDTNGQPDIFVYDRVLLTTTRVSVGAGGVQGNDFTESLCAISGDGTVVAFTSSSDNLVAGDNNLSKDVFVRDLAAGTTERVSVDSLGNETFPHGNEVALSTNGRLCAFASLSDGLNPADTNSNWDIYLRDRSAGTTIWLSQALGGGNANTGVFLDDMSNDGRYIAMQSDATDLIAGDTNLRRDEFVLDRYTGITRRISISTAGFESDEGSIYGAFSGDGTMVAFESLATNLVIGDTNAATDVFMRQHAVKVSGVLIDPTYIGDFSLRTLTFEILNGAGTVLETIPNVPLTSTGAWQFTTSLPGTYTLSANGLTWLRKLKPGVVISSTGVSGISITITNGDADGSGEVDAADIDLVIAGFGGVLGNPGYDPRADLDGSTEVDAADIDLAIANFGALDD